MKVYCDNIITWCPLPIKVVSFVSGRFKTVRGCLKLYPVNTAGNPYGSVSEVSSNGSEVESEKRQTASSENNYQGDIQKITIVN